MHEIVTISCAIAPLGHNSAKKAFMIGIIQSIQDSHYLHRGLWHHLVYHLL